MFFPPQLYGVDTKGLAGSLLELVTIARGGTATSTTFDFGVGSANPLPSVPPDRVWLIFQALCSYDAAAAQNFQGWYMRDIDETNLVVAEFAGVNLSGNTPQTSVEAATPFPAIFSSGFAGYVLLPRHQLAFHAKFNAGASNNVVRFLLQAWAVPRGKIALGIN